DGLLDAGRTWADLVDGQLGVFGQQGCELSSRRPRLFEGSSKTRPPFRVLLVHLCGRELSVDIRRSHVVRRPRITARSQKAEGTVQPLLVDKPLCDLGSRSCQEGWWRNVASHFERLAEVIEIVALRPAYRQSHRERLAASTRSANALL